MLSVSSDYLLSGAAREIWLWKGLGLVELAGSQGPKQAESAWMELDRVLQAITDLEKKRDWGIGRYGFGGGGLTGRIWSFGENRQ